MLSELQITNFALIAYHRIEFHAGMSVLTGETGAGKSIIIDALSLVLGDRADSAVIRHGTEKCEIAARFEIRPDSSAAVWLNEQQLDSEGECVLRRVLSLDGKSRATVNGCAVTLQQLRGLAEHLVDIHGQHEHQSLLKRQHQRALVDQYGGYQALLAELKTHYLAWHQDQQRLTALLDASEQQSRQEFLQFQLDEWQPLALSSTAITDLEREHKDLAHMGDRLTKVQTALELLSGETPLDQALHLACQQLHGLTEQPQLANALTSLEGAAIQLDEASKELQHYLEATELNPQRLADIEALLEQLYRLTRKHRVKVIELPEVYAKLEAELQQLNSGAADYQQLCESVAQHLKAYQNVAARLSEQRLATAARLSQQIGERMQQLGMGGGCFEIRCEAEGHDTPSLGGAEQLEFYVSANPGQPLQALAKIASGGELSRISLAIQVILAGSTTTPTLIFDEVDVGIGGPTAAIVGQLLRDLSRHTQVLCVTHLAQVAACGHHHFQIAKHSAHSSTTTEISLLDTNTREQEIARMLSGLSVTEQSLAHARDLLHQQ